MNKPSGSEIVRQQLWELVKSRSSSSRKAEDVLIDAQIILREWWKFEDQLKAKMEEKGNALQDESNVKDGIR